MFSGSQSAESSEALRQLLSVWYYYFPGDNHVRRGDLVELGENGDLGFVITPPCDLVRFPKKTGRRLTWLRMARLDANGITALQTAGINIDAIGGSIIGEHGKAGDTVILLPNVPLAFGKRDRVADYVILCHAWDSKLLEGAPDGSLLYGNIIPFARRCTLADPYASGVVSKIMSVISSPGTPDLPKGERIRLRAAVAVQLTTPEGTAETYATAQPAQARPLVAQVALFSFNQNVIRVFKLTFPYPAEPVIVERIVHESFMQAFLQPQISVGLKSAEHVLPGQQVFFREEIELL